MSLLWVHGKRAPALLFFDTLKDPDLLDHRSGFREEHTLVRGSLSG